MLHGIHVYKSDIIGDLPLDPYQEQFDLYYLFGVKSYVNNQRDIIDKCLGSFKRSRYNKIHYTPMHSCVVIKI